MKIRTVLGVCGYVATVTVELPDRVARGLVARGYVTVEGSGSAPKATTPEASEPKASKGD